MLKYAQRALAALLFLCAPAAAFAATITVVDSGTTSASGQGSVSIVSGTPTAGSFVQQSTGGSVAAMAVTVTGTFTGTLNFETSADGATFAPVNCTLVGATTTASAATGDGTFNCPVGQASAFRVRASSLGAGTPAVAIGIYYNTGWLQTFVSQVGTWVMTGFKDSGGTDMTSTTAHALKSVIVDGSGNALNPTAPAATYPACGLYQNITTKTNTRLTAAAGHVLCGITINKPGSADTLTVKDSAASDCSGGTTVGTITVASSSVAYYQQGWLSTNGICIVSGGTTAGDYTAWWF